MRPTSKTENSRRSPPRLASYRPSLELLEDRLPPGDVLLGRVLASSWLGQSISVLGSDSLASMSGQADALFAQQRLTSSSTWVVEPTHRSSPAAFFAGGLSSSQGDRPPSHGEPAKGENQAADHTSPAYHDMLGLDKDLLGRLVANDFDALLSLPSSFDATAKRGSAGVVDAEPKASGSTPGSTSAGAGDLSHSTGEATTSPALSPSNGLPALGSSAPNLATGGILDGTAVAQPSLAAGAAEVGASVPHGFIRPLSIDGQATTPGKLPDGPGLQSAPAWPSDTPPTSPDLLNSARGVYDHSISPGSSFSAAGVRYFDGQLKLLSIDLGSTGFGTPWGQTRNWTNGIAPLNTFNGAGEIESQRPYVLRPNGDDTKIIVVSSAINARYFDLSGGVYVPHFFVQDVLTHPSGEFVLTDTKGDQLHFYDFSVTQVNQRGQFKSFSDPKGNLMSVVSLTSDGKLAETQRTDSSSGVTESYLYTYLAAPDLNAGLLSNVTLRRQVNGGPWTTVRQVAYDYYDGTAQKPYGNLGDLRTATIEDGATPTPNVLDTKYYRYYTSSDIGSIGYVHGLKYAFNPQSYARLAAGVASPLTATDTLVSPYADDYFEYDPVSQRVTKAIVQGTGSSTGGQGTFRFTYATSSNPNGYNSWASKTIETLPDSNTNTVYANYAGEVMLRVFQSGGLQWETFYKYDGAGRIILKANPSALTGYNDTFADLLDQTQVGDYGYLSSSTGLIEVTDYGTTTSAGEGTAGDVLGYYKDTKLEQGKSGTAVLQKAVQYFAHTGGGATVYPVAGDTPYRNTDGTGGETTSYSYTWYTGTVQMQTMTTNRPLISAAQNGPGVADTESRNYDIYGRVTQLTDPDGYVQTTAYDPATGAVTQTVRDAGTGHLNLTTSVVVDGLGRTTKLTDPNGNVTYTVYNDPNHEIRTYPGWQTATNLATGPTHVSRQDRAHDPSYTESFNMSATPHVPANGQPPDGTEAYGFLQSLSRTITSDGGQTSEEDAYFYLGGQPYTANIYIGTAGANFYATNYVYDTRGRRNRVLSPTGTIYRTVYDALGRESSTWVGTNDAASGGWSPTNNGPPSNMVQITGNVYDGGSGGGDSNLTQVTRYPGGSAANRVTQNFYDWRDRLVASKDGVQANEDTTTHRPILYSQLDNLGQVVSSERYDGDAITITSTGGVPNRPDASKLRAKTTPQYDDQGRVFQSNTFSVDQTNGTVSANSLTTNTWYAHRGSVVKVSEPGGMVIKTTYDAADRPVTVYSTDGYGDSTWSDANTVSSTNNVLKQTQTTYDNAGRVIFLSTRERFDNETAGGPLGDPATHPYARVSYIANYYDGAKRLTDTVDVGTNHGTTYTRPASPDARSDTVLVTSNGYKADAVQQVTLSGPPTGGTFTLTFGGQTTSAIAYNASASVVQSALQSLSTIGASNALVSGPGGGPWLVRFAGTLAETAEPDMTANGSGLIGGSVNVGTTSQGGNTGRAQKVTDPQALLTKTDYDLKGRTLRTVENFVSFTPSNAADRTTQFTYDGSDHVLTRAAILPGGSSQTTQYTYGVTGSVINSNDLLATVTYAANGQPNTESYTYNALSQVASRSDRNGSTHSYSYDVLGRQTTDSVTTLGANVDGTVRRLDNTYDTGGRAYLFTSYADTAGTTITNQVQRGYNGLGQLTSEAQAHGGAVIGGTPAVQYAYSFVPTAGGPNHSRLVSVTYPNMAAVRVLSSNYNTGVDDRISRLSSLSDSSATLEAYSYLGLGTVVKRSHPQPGVDLTYIKQTGEPNGDAGDQYTGLDRFGRVVDQRWTASGGGTTTDRFQYGYDRDGNRLYRDNLVNAAFGELYHANGAANGYDGLNQVTAFSRGTLNTGKDTIASPTHTQAWNTLDAAGNWASFTSDSTTQTRTHNVQNQIASISGLTTPTYDNNGNTTTDENGKTLVYDAWNRLVRYNGTTTVSYAYDALNRRVSSATGGTTTDLYYSQDWQVVEEQIGGVMQRQYVWSSVYVDALIERDASGQRLYVQQDANWNVTAVVDTTGNGAGALRLRPVRQAHGRQRQLRCLNTELGQSRDQPVRLDLLAPGRALRYH